MVAAPELGVPHLAQSSNRYRKRAPCASGAMAVLKKTKNNAYNDVLNKVRAPRCPCTALTTLQIAAGTAPHVMLSGFKLQKLPYEELLDFLATDKTVTGLDLSKNELGDEGAQAIAKLLRVNTNITTIDLRFNKITTLGASHLVTALQESNYVVSSLLLQEDTKGLDATFSKLFNLTEIIPVIEVSPHSGCASHTAAQFVCELNKGLSACKSTKGPELRFCRRALRQLPPVLNDMCGLRACAPFSRRCLGARIFNGSICPRTSSPPSLLRMTSRCNSSVNNL